MILQRNYYNTHFDPLTKKAIFAERPQSNDSLHQKLCELTLWIDDYGSQPHVMDEYNALLTEFLSSIVLSVDGIRERCPCCNHKFCEMIDMFKYPLLTLNDENKERIKNIKLLARLPQIDKTFFCKVEQEQEEELSMDDNLGHFDDDDDVIDAQTHDDDMID
jgi:hypothetical protein